MQRVPRTAVIVPVAVLAFILTAMVAASSGHHGRPSTALARAARTMQTTSAYRFTARVSAAGSTTTIAGEYQAPDRIHEVITPPRGRPVEATFGGKAQGSGNANSQADPREAFAVLAQATNVKAAHLKVANGSSYTFDLPTAASAKLLSTTQSVKAARGQATIGRAGIVHLSFHFVQGSHLVDVAIDYRDIGSDAIHVVAQGV